MTREEVIAFFKDMNECTYGNLEAVDMAIKALEQEPCEDCVSRQAVLGKAIDYGSNTYLIPVNSVKALPPVTPQPKTGHWIVYTDCEGKTRRCVCDQCGNETGKYTWKNPNFCDNCGAKMVEPQESEDNNGNSL